MATKTNTTINGRDYYRIRRKVNGIQKTFYGKSKGDAERKYKEYLKLIAGLPSVTACEPLSQTFGEMATNYITNALKPSDRYAESPDCVRCAENVEIPTSQKIFNHFLTPANRKDSQSCGSLLRKRGLRYEVFFMIFFVGKE